MVPVVGAFGVQRERRRQLHRLLLVSSDAVGLCISVVLATFVRFGNLNSTIGFENTTTDVLFVQLGALLVPVWLILLWAEGLYDLERLSWGSGELSRVARSLALGVVALIFVTYAIKLPGLSRAWSLLFWLFATFIVLLGRASIKLLQRFRHIRGLNLRPVLVVGSNSESADIIHVLNASRAEGLVPVGCLASSQADRLNLDWCAHDVPCLGSARELRSVVQQHDIDTVIIASTAFEHEVLARLVTDLRGTGVDIHISSGLLDVLASRVLVREIGGVPLITVKGVSLSRSKVLTKRAFDLILATSIVILAMPLWLFVMFLIRLTPGPVFYRQERVGRDGEHFGMLKFRSMVMDADARLDELQQANQASGPLFKMKDDPRVTPVGRWMRKFSIDEFPQLINVIRGEMSLVGPRPPLPREVTQYTDRDWRRMEVVPGMTGLWQVSGRSSLTFDEMVRLDLFYIENWSVGLDLSLLLRTIPAVVMARGAY